MIRIIQRRAMLHSSDESFTRSRNSGIILVKYELSLHLHGRMIYESDVMCQRSIYLAGLQLLLERKAKITKRINNAQYDGTVTGSNDAEHSVHIDLEHVRKSRCNCPHADGKRIICKHMIALFFTSFPLEAKKYNEELIAYEREAELQAEEDECKVLSFVSGLKKAELQEILMQLLYDGPEWQWDKFIREYVE